ncbi:MAG: hypothetical protein OJI67_14730 [Prosthecobacter sp.]|nr:hypothetical protein [Prosthecobacter sp.]
MSGQSANEPCHLRCRWNGKEMCVRRLLTPEAIAEHHLSLGVACGLRHVYFPNNLPPCVHNNGEIDWEYAETEMNEEEAVLA